MFTFDGSLIAMDGICSEALIHAINVGQFSFLIGWFEWWGDFYYFSFYCLLLALISLDGLYLVIFSSLLGVFITLGFHCIS